MSREDARKLPVGWRWAKLGDTCDIKGGKRLPAGTDFVKESTPHPYIRVVDFRDGSVDDSQLKYLDLNTQRQISRYIINKDDVFISIAGTIGVVGVIPDHLDGANLTENAARLVIQDSTLLSRDYLSVFLRSSLGQEAIRLRTNTVGQPKLALERIRTISIPLPPLPEQKRIATILTKQMAVIENARAAAEARLKAAKELPAAYIRDSYDKGGRRSRRLSDCLVHVSKGVGPTWSKFPVLGATRAGLAPAKEGVGKTPERYKLVDEGTVFYNPMRILLGSIAMIDEGDEPGITSPDYVALKGKDGVVNSRWFYYWMRSPYGENFIKSMSRGAVRERMLFNRLAEGEVEFPSWQAQQEAAEKMKHVRPIQTLIEEEIKAINAMPALLLQRAFSGEL